MNRTNSIKQLARHLSIFLLFGVCTISCKKSDTPQPIAPPVVVTDPSKPDDGLFYKLIRVENLAGDTTNSGQPTAAKQDFYFSLEQNKRKDATYKTTSQWDVAFTGIENAGISANNGSDINNFGYRDQAVGAIAIIEKDFNDVTEIPSNLKWITDKSGIFLDDAGTFGSGIGWALYDFGGSTVGDGTRPHVCYALGYPLKLRDGTTVPARTLLVRTANGNMAKIRMISIYKSLFKPEDWHTNSPVPYFTFEYVIIPKGETKFKINQ